MRLKVEANLSRHILSGLCFRSTLFNKPPRDTDSYTMYSTAVFRPGAGGMSGGMLPDSSDDKDQRQRLSGHEHEIWTLVEHWLVGIVLPHAGWMNRASVRHTRTSYPFVQRPLALVSSTSEYLHKPAHAQMSPSSDPATNIHTLTCSARSSKTTRGRQTKRARVPGPNPVSFQDTLPNHETKSPLLSLATQRAKSRSTPETKTSLSFVLRLPRASGCWGLFHKAHKCFFVRGMLNYL